MSKELTREEMKRQGYSPLAIAIAYGGPVGSPEYYKILEAEGGLTNGNCPHCGEPCFGTGDCNCMGE